MKHRGAGMAQVMEAIGDLRCRSDSVPPTVKITWVSRRSEDRRENQVMIVPSRTCAQPLLMLPDKMTTQCIGSERGKGNRRVASPFFELPNDKGAVYTLDLCANMNAPPFQVYICPMEAEKFATA